MYRTSFRMFSFLLFLGKFLSSSAKNVLPGKNSCRPLLAGKVLYSLLAERIEHIYFPSSSLTALGKNSGKGEGSLPRGSDW